MVSCSAFSCPSVGMDGSCAPRKLFLNKSQNPMDASHGIPHILALSILKVTFPKSCSGSLSPLLSPSLHSPKVWGAQNPPDLTNLPLLPDPFFKGIMSEKAPSIQATADRVSSPTLFLHVKMKSDVLPKWTDKAYWIYSTGTLVQLKKQLGNKSVW